MLGNRPKGFQVVRLLDFATINPAPFSLDLVSILFVCVCVSFFEVACPFLSRAPSSALYPVFVRETKNPQNTTTQPPATGHRPHRGGDAGHLSPAAEKGGARRADLMPKNLATAT